MGEVHQLPRQSTEQALAEENAGLHDELAELLKKFKGQSRELAELRRDKQADAEADEAWPTAVRLFKYLNRRLDHPRCKWSHERFTPFIARLLHEPDGLEHALRAISGCLSDDWRMRKGLSLWEDVLGSEKALERCLAKCPADWKPPSGYEKAPVSKGVGDGRGP